MNLRGLTQRQRDILALIEQNGVATFGTGIRGRLIRRKTAYGIHIKAYTYPNYFLEQRGLIERVGEFQPTRYRLTKEYKDFLVKPA